MTIVLRNNPEKFSGTSADTKPTTDIPPGSELYETDTGKTYVWNNTTWKEKSPLIDGFTGAKARISMAHLHIHKKESFVFDYADENLGDNDTMILAFKTPVGTKRVHFFPEYSTLVGGDLRIYEDSYWTPGSGSAVSVVNRFREDSPTASVILENVTSASAFTATNKLIVNPTGIDNSAASTIQRSYAWGKKEKFAAGSIRDDNEFVLNPDTAYAVVFTAEGGSNKAHMNLNWYEHTDKS